MTSSCLFRLLFALSLTTGSAWAQDPATNSALANGSGTPPGPLAQAIQPLIDKGDFAGGVFLVATKDKIVEEEALGYRDLDAKAPEKDDDLFWIASQGKAMDCAVLMMLVDEGKVTVDDPVEKYLPEFQGQKVKDPTAPGGKADLVRPIELHDLMSHMSGLPFAAPMEKPTLDASPLADRVKAYAQLTLNHQPGKNWDYSNAGLNTIGRVIEVVTGEPYEQALSERLLKPLQMNDTTFFPTADQLQRLACSYKATGSGLKRVNIDQLKYPLDGPGRYAMPAGGLFSTAEDVMKFCRMLMAGGLAPDGTRLLSEASVQAMTRVEIPNGGHYGFGLGIDGDGFSHGGAYKSVMSVKTGKGLVEIMMVSQQGDFANGLKGLSKIVSTAADEAVKQSGP